MISFWGWFRYWIWTLLDALPPYGKVEGLLESKDIDSRGKFRISVDWATVEVDRATFNVLAVGERLRVRFTRGYRAINIDRVVPRREAD